MSKMIKKLKYMYLLVRSIFSTLYFNFKCLPFKQAVHLPVILYKPKFLSLSGKFIISSPTVKFGMIKLGVPNVSFYGDKGIRIENYGTVYFSGSCSIGSDSTLSVGRTGYLKIGANFCASAAMKLACFNQMSFGDNVRLGWDVTALDTDFHTLTYILGGGKSKGYGAVRIDDYVWIGAKTTILKNTHVPEKCVVGSSSVLNKKYDCEAGTVIYGNPAKTKYTGMYLDPNDDKIDYNL